MLTTVSLEIQQRGGEVAAPQLRVPEHLADEPAHLHLIASVYAAPQFVEVRRLVVVDLIALVAAPSVDGATFLFGATHESEVGREPEQEPLRHRHPPTAQRPGASDKT